MGKEQRAHLKYLHGFTEKVKFEIDCILGNILRTYYELCHKGY
jgi:hypothetical protein